MSHSLGKYDLLRKLHQSQQCSYVELGTLQQLALTVIVNSYPERKETWVGYIECIPAPLRKEICKRLLYRGMLDNDLFSLTLDPLRTVWDLRQIGENFTDQSCKVLERVKNMELLRLNKPSCSPEGMRKMLEQFTSIKLLEIINTKLLDDKVVEVIAKHCKFLDALSLKGTGITDEALKAIAVHELKISELDISNNSITPEGINHLQSGPTKYSLTLMHFRQCPNLSSPKIVTKVISAFPNLKDYSFDFMFQDDDAVRVALDELPAPAPGQNVYFNIPL